MVCLGLFFYGIEKELPREQLFVGFHFYLRQSATRKISSQDSNPC